MLKTLIRIIRPYIIGVKHIFMTPITVKYPYERIVNVTGENYRYDPKAGIAYPGYKGRHVLYLNKCTGCSLCDIACQNISEAITMVYGFNVTLEIDKPLYEAFKRGEAEATGFFESLVDSLSPAQGDGITLSVGHPVVPVAWSDIRSIKQKDENTYEWRLNLEPVYDYRSEAVVEKHLGRFIRWLRENGWEDKIVTVEGADKEDEFHEITKGNYRARLSIVKITENYPQNKKSYFPAVDYGRCVFCGFCVDACPFYALEMGPEYELSAYDRASLVYNPKMLAGPPKTAPPAELGWFERLHLILKELTER